MRKVDPIRAWKDPVYRATLSAGELAEIPAHPAGILEVEDEQLRATSGGGTTAPTCTAYTFFHLRACCPSTT